MYLEDRSRGSNRTRFLYSFNETENIQFRYRFSDRYLDRIVRLNEANVLRVKRGRINQIGGGGRKRERKRYKKFRAAVIFAARM